MSRRAVSEAKKKKPVPNHDVSMEFTFGGSSVIRSVIRERISQEKGKAASSFLKKDCQASESKKSEAIRVSVRNPSCSDILGAIKRDTFLGPRFILK